MVQESMFPPRVTLMSCSLRRLDLGGWAVRVSYRREGYLEPFSGGELYGPMSLAEALQVIEDVASL